MRGKRTLSAVVATVIGLLVSGLVTAPMEQQPCDGQQPSQWWRWLGADNNGHLVLNSGLGNYCMALVGYSTRDNWPIVMNECATTSGQLYRAA